MIFIQLGDFRIARFLFCVTAGSQGLELPAYKGSTLRGGFGSAFKQIVCREKWQGCLACIVKDVCPYPFIFESMSLHNADNLDTVPRPFILEPPLTQQTVFEPGESINFGLVLIGKAISYIPYFMAAFQRLGTIGLGKGRKSFVLDQVFSLDENGNCVEMLYREGERVNNLPYVITGKQTMERVSGTCRIITMQFETMTRLRVNHALTMDLSFQTLYRNLVRRISALSRYYHEEPWVFPYREMIEASSHVTTKDSRLEWVDWERFSRRQDTRMTLGGFVGEVVFEGDIDEFLPVISLGQFVHVGKATTFGLGKYKLVLGG